MHFSVATEEYSVTEQPVCDLAAHCFVSVGMCRFVLSQNIIINAHVCRNKRYSWPCICI